MKNIHHTKYTTTDHTDPFEYSEYKRDSFWEFDWHAAVAMVVLAILGVGGLMAL